MRQRTCAVALWVAMAVSLAALPVRAADAAEQEPPQAAECAQVYIPDPEGTITFENLERRLRENHPGILGLEETIASIRAIDFDDMYQEIRENLNQLADAQWGMLASAPNGLGGVMASTLEAQYDALWDTYEDLKAGELQKNYLDAIWQLETVQERTIAAEESFYMGLVELELEDRALTRSLAAMDRMLHAAQLRYELGYLPAAELERVKADRAALASGQTALERNLANLKTRLERMTGEAVNGASALGALPTVTEEALSNMDLEADLAAAKEKSYSLYEAKQTLDAAEETFEEFFPSEANYKYVAARHTWQAAQHDYQSVVQGFEESFRTLWVQVTDARQRQADAQTALAAQENAYDRMQIKYEQGQVSRNALLDAQDLVEACREEVERADIRLFAAYHTYAWATQSGII